MELVWSPIPLLSVTLALSELLAGRHGVDCSEETTEYRAACGVVIATQNSPRLVTSEWSSRCWNLDTRIPDDNIAIVGDGSTEDYSLEC